MSAYKVKDGHNQALEDLVALDPQPKSEGVKCTRRSFAADGTPIDEGRYIELVWSMLPDVTTYQSVLSQLGIQSALSNQVTAYVRDETFAWVRVNGLAIRPEPGRDVRWTYFPRDVTILIRDVEAAL